MLKTRIIKNLLIAFVSLIIITKPLYAETIQAELQKRYGTPEALKSTDELTRELAEIYTARNFAPYWYNETGKTEAASHAINAFERANQEGLDPEDYLLASKSVGAAESNPAKNIDAEIALTKTALQYLKDMRGDRVDPNKIKKELYLKKFSIDASRIFAENMTADPSGAWLQIYTLQNPNYQALKGFLADYQRKLAAAGGKDPALAKKIEQIVINMERWRWLPETMPNRYVMVNIAAFELKAVEGNQVAFETPVIIGHVTRKTPVFASTIEAVRFNPSWHVPHQLAVKDKLRKIKADPSYVERSGFVLYNSAGQAISAHSVNWSNVSAGNFNYHLRQVPGPRNALGKIRFTFPNNYNVYIHDTPEKDLFNESERDFSSGCIRVKDPVKLARFVFNDTEHWSDENIKKNMKGNLTKNIPLAQTVPVYVTYFTVWKDNQGMHFEKDIYGRDQQLREALKARTHRLS
jgi:murein L,D-transpeptidase YcbB/YkuD